MYDYDAGMAGTFPHDRTAAHRTETAAHRVAIIRCLVMEFQLAAHRHRILRNHELGGMPRATRSLALSALAMKGELRRRVRDVTHGSTGTTAFVGIHVLSSASFIYTQA